MCWYCGCSCCCKISQLVSNKFLFFQFLLLLKLSLNKMTKYPWILAWIWCCCFFFHSCLLEIGHLVICIRSHSTWTRTWYCVCACLVQLLSDQKKMPAKWSYSFRFICCFVNLIRADKKCYRLPNGARWMGLYRPKHERRFDSNFFCEVDFLTRYDKFRREARTIFVLTSFYIYFFFWEGGGQN